MNKAEIYKTFEGFDVVTYPVNYGLSISDEAGVIEERYELEVLPHVHVDLTEISRDEAIKLIRDIIKATNGDEHEV